jgi:hypothetical protein
MVTSIMVGFFDCDVVQLERPIKASYHLVDSNGGGDETLNALTSLSWMALWHFVMDMKFGLQWNKR